MASVDNPATWSGAQRLKAIWLTRPGGALRGKMQLRRGSVVWLDGDARARWAEEIGAFGDSVVTEERSIERTFGSLS